jgi:uncharacterized protein YukE
VHPGGVGVDVEVLRGVGQDVAAAATTLQEAVKASGSGLAPASGRGSTAGAAAQKAEKAWFTDLRRLTGQVDEYGRSLTTAAQDYRATDQASANDLWRSGAGQER